MDGYLGGRAGALWVSLAMGWSGCMPTAGTLAFPSLFLLSLPASLASGFTGHMPPFMGSVGNRTSPLPPTNLLHFLQVPQVGGWGGGVLHEGRVLSSVESLEPSEASGFIR